MYRYMQTTYQYSYIHTIRLMYAYHYNTLLLQIWIVYQASCQKSGHLQVLPQLYVTLSSLQQDTWHLAARAGNKAWGGSSRHSVVLSPQHPLTASWHSPHLPGLSSSYFHQRQYQLQLCLHSASFLMMPCIPMVSYWRQNSSQGHWILQARAHCGP